MNKIFKCACGDLVHSIEFNLDSIMRDGVDITLVVNKQPRLLDRLKVAMSYVFGYHTTTWDYDGVVLRTEQRQDLIDFLSKKLGG